MEKNTFGKITLVYSGLLISCGTLTCYFLITKPRLLHSIVGFAALFSLFVGVFCLLGGLKVYYNMKER